MQQHRHRRDGHIGRHDRGDTDGDGEPRRDDGEGRRRHCSRCRVTTLATALTAAGLVDTLKGEGPFTVFAPTDEAFAALPTGTLDALLADPTGDLTSILTYHVVPGKVMAADVLTLDGQKVATVNGAEITVNVEGSMVSLTDAKGNTVNVTQTDIEASNGVIHVIDAVLMP